MKIHGLCCSVNYADLLDLGILRWARSLASLTVVTDTRDDATAKLATAWGCQVVRTDVFYANGATFNKGAALEEARRSMPWRDWALFFDADIVPEYEWKARVEAYNPTPGGLYSARRRECMDPARVDDDALPEIAGDGVGVGYFQLFHTEDPRVQTDGGPLLDTRWRHAGVYDCVFKDRWPVEKRVLMPLRLTHVGERDNWLGRGNRQGFADLMAERAKRGGYDHERISSA